MTLPEIILSQIIEPFRIGLIVALIYTAARTRATTGTVLPLLAGLVFVAVIIPATMQGNAGPDLWTAVLAGLVANAVILGVAMALWALIRRLRG
jgi:hypothetical protein